MEIRSSRICSLDRLARARMRLRWHVRERSQEAGGTITDISGGKVVRVERIWKGNIGRTFDTPEVIEGAACLGSMKGCSRWAMTSWFTLRGSIVVRTTKIISRVSALGRIYRAMWARISAV